MPWSQCQRRTSLGAIGTCDEVLRHAGAPCRRTILALCTGRAPILPHLLGRLPEAWGPGPTQCMARARATREACMTGRQAPSPALLRWPEPGHCQSAGHALLALLDAVIISESVTVLWCGRAYSVRETSLDILYMLGADWSNAGAGLRAGLHASGRPCHSSSAHHTVSSAPCMQGMWDAQGTSPHMLMSDPLSMMSRL